MLADMSIEEIRKLAGALSLIMVLEGRMSSKKALARLREALGDAPERE